MFINFYNISVSFAVFQLDLRDCRDSQPARAPFKTALCKVSRHNTAEAYNSWKTGQESDLWRSTQRAVSFSHRSLATFACFHTDRLTLRIRRRGDTSAGSGQARRGHEGKNAHRRETRINKVEEESGTDGP